MATLGNRWFGYLSLLTVFLALLGLSTVQIIATASNLYLLSDALVKRTYSLIVGGFFCLVTLLPTFRHYRLFVILALVATMYTAWYMTIASAVQGPIANVQYNGPVEPQRFFSALTALLFQFGGHSASIEKADVMDNRKSYASAFGIALLYVYTITLPNGIAAYHTFGSVAESRTNAFYLFPADIYRDIGISLMCLHEFVAFGLFCGPLFHIWEKALGIASAAFGLRVLARLFVVWSMIFLAVAFPFFGTINGLLGAFTTTFASFIIPCMVYNMSFKDDNAKDREHVLLPKWTRLGARGTRIINWILAVAILIVGVGFGGWSAVKTLIDEVETFDVFDPCYRC